MLELLREPFSCFWAPEITEHEGRFYMYYHPCRAEKGGYHICVAVADRPEGPYRDTGTPLTDPDKNPFAIDSHAFRDDDGQWYLFYATDFLDFDETTFRGTALVVPALQTAREKARTIACVSNLRQAGLGILLWTGARTTTMTQDILLGTGTTICDADAAVNATSDTVPSPTRDLTGLLVNRVQRFCLHDGPGLHSTVFLQGCPLRCWW